MSETAFANLVALCGTIFVLAIMAFYAISLIWLYRDSEARGKTGCMWLLIAFFTWPFGLFAYLILRDRNVHL